MTDVAEIVAKYHARLSAKKAKDADHAAKREAYLTREPQWGEVWARHDGFCFTIESVTDDAVVVAVRPETGVPDIYTISKLQIMGTIGFRREYEILDDDGRPVFVPPLSAES